MQAHVCAYVRTVIIMAGLSLVHTLQDIVVQQPGHTVTTYESSASCSQHQTDAIIDVTGALHIGHAGTAWI